MACPISAEAAPMGLPCKECEDTALSVESNSNLITESSEPPPYTSGMGRAGPCSWGGIALAASCGCHIFTKRKPTVHHEGLR
eukprot:360958-Chlamydomonas_euryale.AAC.12